MDLLSRKFDVDLGSYGQPLYYLPRPIFPLLRSGSILSSSLAVFETEPAATTLSSGSLPSRASRRMPPASTITCEWKRPPIKSPSYG
jgi:hypothetical protein